MGSPPGDGLGLHTKGMRPSELVAFYAQTVAELRAALDTLKGAAGFAEEIQTLAQPRAWMVDLTRQERALVGALLAASPRTVSPLALLDILPGRDHADDRELNIVNVIVCRARSKLGKAAIQTQRGEGFSIPADQKARLLAA